jgi:hypothetical protein
LTVFDIGTKTDAGLYPGAFLCNSSFLDHQQVSREKIDGV